jgi:glycosyltransferase involved in cell wall biosynthesis
MTKVLFIHALDFKLDNAGNIYTPGGIDNNYLKRYSDSNFGERYIVSRSSEYNSKFDSSYEKLIDINPYFLKKYTGGYQFLFKYSFYKDLYDFLNQNDTMIVINYPSSTGLFLILFSYIFNFNYVVEVASDSDTYRGKRFGLIVQVFSEIIGKICVPKAIGALYVATFLKDKWHCKNGVVCSNVFIENFSIPRTFNNKKTFKIVSVGAISYRKGIDFILSELKDVNDDFIIELDLVGPIIDDDIFMSAKELNFKNIKINFHGILSKSDIYSILDSADLYVQASRSEGLPRSLIEAMSRGVPVICSSLPGVKGIVQNNYQFNLKSSGSLSILINDLFSFPNKLTKLSLYSVNISKSYSIKILKNKRVDFYNSCKCIIENKLINFK